jgi:hypothetical protein
MENHLTYNNYYSTSSQSTDYTKPLPYTRTTSEQHKLSDRSYDVAVPVIRVCDILGTAEVADILGCPKQQIHTLRKREDFPTPITSVAATPLWDRKSIMSFKSTWIRRKKTA